jgi:hypothetical protein
MPGIFGAVGGKRELAERLKREFVNPWPAFDFVNVKGGVLGGHAFSPKRAVYSLDECSFAVDGELGLYYDANSYVVNGKPELFHLVDGALALTEACKGNVAVVDARTGNWHIGSEWTGTFPLYYFHGRGQLLFSSRLRPLARAVGATVDPIGLYESLVKGYTFGGRTLFEKIRRLLPGQSLTYSPLVDKLNLRENSLLWADGNTSELNDLRAVAEIAWANLKHAVAERISYPGKHGLMMSAGWDSRLLLSAMIESVGAAKVYVYTHGDSKSLELRIARALRESVGVEGHEEPLDSAIFAPADLEIAFDRAETIIFPEWVRAGAMGVSLGLQSQACGVYAAVLGGHNGPTAATKGARRLVVGSRSLLEQLSGIAVGPKMAAAELLPFSLKKPSYVRQGVFKTALDYNEAARADFEYDIDRLERRGIRNPDRFVEAFISEHRGTQYMEAQPLSCRAGIDVNIPYIDRSLLSVASRIPFRLKFHNAIHRVILQNHAPHLLRFPCSATLVPAYMPIPVQEASRVARRCMERITWKLYFLTGGKIQPVRFGWPNYEFLRQKNTLHSLVDSLTADLWDKTLLRKWLLSAAKFSDRRKMSFIWQPLLRIFYTDLMLRK